MSHAEDDFPTHDQIETRAYELYLVRGEDTSAIENWLAAEDQLKQERASAPLLAKATSAGQRNPG
jgi:hypothetical protein